MGALVGPVALCVVIALGGCAESRTLNVFVASSLGTATREALAPELASGRVRVSAAGSQTLARQIAEGAPASLFLPAEARHLDVEGVADRVGAHREFLCNGLVLVARDGLPPPDLASLGSVGSLVLGVPEVPVGAYADRLLDSAAEEYGGAWRASVAAAVRSRELDARQVAARVASGEADAALVYRTDALAAGLTPIELPPAHRPPVRYVLAALSDGPQPARAEALARRLAEGELDAAFVARGFEVCP